MFTIEDLQKTTQFNVNTNVKGNYDSRPENITVSGRRIYLVFQGAYYFNEHRYKYIVAPWSRPDGRCISHWERVKDVKKNDIIFHVYNGYITDIGIANTNVYHGCRKGIIESNDAVVDCEYDHLSNEEPIYIHKEVNASYSNIIGAPFNKNGDGNQGYLFKMPLGLAKKYIHWITQKNSSFLEKDYVQDIIKS